MQAKYESVKKESEIQSLNIEKAQFSGRNTKNQILLAAGLSFSLPACCSGSTGG
jgi:hypothetical protein